MGMEKTGVKAGGLFHLFDWNKKSRKKLFANGNVSSDVAKGGTKGNDNAQTSRPCLIEDDDSRGLSSVKGSSDHSCASSVTDEEGNGIRAPGVVARLMGLDSLPMGSLSEPYSTPLFDSKSLRENSYQKRGSEFDIDDCFSTIARSDRYARKPLDLRSQKMPSSPIERFQMEALPPRSAKSLPVAHKLLSPIKNSSFLSGKNAAYVMETAAKILEPGLRANAKGKAHSLGSSPLSLGVQDSKESIAVSQRLSRLPESSRGPLESNAFKYLKGYSLNKSWNSPEDSVSVRASPDWGETSSTGAKGKGGKTISLAVQAKVNVQRREGSTTSSRSVPVHREQDETKTNQPFNCQQGCKNKPQKNASAPGPSGVLKQNNQKQNCLSNRDKVTAKSSMSSQQGKKVPSGDANPRKDRILNKIHGGSKVACRKEDLQVTDLERDGSSSRTKNVPRKKRLIDRNHQSDSDTVLVGNHEKHIQSCVMIDEHRKWDEYSRRNGTDIVSFTFKSPMIKSTGGSQPTHITKKHNISSFSVVMEGERNRADPKNSRLPSGLNVISGDALSVLLEQKLRELTSGLQSSSSNMGKVVNTSPSASDLLSAFENSHAASVEYQKEPSQGPCNGGICNVSDDLFSVNDRLSNLCTKLQGEEGTAECSSSGSDAQKGEPEQRHPSPFSILEASFSSESCSSSDSSNSNNGSKICSSVDAQSYIGLNCKDSAGEAETDLLDSASSMCVETANEERASGIASPTEIPSLEMEYVRDIIQISGIDFMDMASGGLNHNLDHLFFDLLENKRSSSSNGPVDKNHRLWRKMLFDCVRECLESKCSRFFKGGCRSWAKGIAMIGREDEFAGDIYKEISRWKGVGDDWMVDELVDKDMSSNLGRWVDFELEEFEAGVEIEKAILSCLIDEVVADVI